MVDLCFDLAYLLRCSPDVFLDKPLDDLAFYAEAGARLSKRMRRANGAA